MSEVIVTESYLGDIAEAIRAKNGTQNTYKPSQMAAAITAIPSGSVNEPLSVTENGTYTAPSGVGYSPVTVDVGSGGLYELGYEYVFQSATCFAKNNHFKAEFSATMSSQSLHMHGTTMAMPLWFTVPAGSAVLRYYNIVSTGIKWNANAKKAGTNTSLTWGIGNDYHEDEVIKTRNIVTAEDVGNWFVYIESAPAGSILEFDMSLTVDGVRYI